jgi:hypothetical protein
MICEFRPSPKSGTVAIMLAILCFLWGLLQKAAMLRHLYFTAPSEQHLRSCRLSRRSDHGHTAFLPSPWPTHAMLSWLNFVEIYLSDAFSARRGFR